MEEVSVVTTREDFFLFPIRAENIWKEFSFTVQVCQRLERIASKGDRNSFHEGNVNKNTIVVIRLWRYL